MLNLVRIEMISIILLEVGLGQIMEGNGKGKTVAI